MHCFSGRKSESIFIVSAATNDPVVNVSRTENRRQDIWTHEPRENWNRRESASEIDGAFQNGFCSYELTSAARDALLVIIRQP